MSDKFGINLSRIADRFSRANMQTIKDHWLTNPIANGQFKLLEFTVTGNPSGHKVAHGLKYAPKDIIQTSAIWSGTAGDIRFRNDQFDGTNIVLDVSGQGADDELKLRILVGRMG